MFQIAFTEQTTSEFFQLTSMQLALASSLSQHLTNTKDCNFYDLRVSWQNFLFPWKQLESMENTHGGA